jgi:hypothetical protein
MPRYTDLRSSLLASLLCLTGCALVIGATRLSTTLDASREHLLQLQSRQAPSALALRELRAQLAELRLYQLSLVAATGNAADVADCDRRIARTLQGVHRQLALYVASRPGGEEDRRFARVRTELDAFLNLHRQLSAAVHAGDRDRAGQLSTQQALPLRRTLFAHLLELDRINARQASASHATPRAYAAR